MVNVSRVAAVSDRDPPVYGRAGLIKLLASLEHTQDLSVDACLGPDVDGGASRHTGQDCGLGGLCLGDEELTAADGETSGGQSRDPGPKWAHYTHGTDSFRRVDPPPFEELLTLPRIRPPTQPGTPLVTRTLKAAETVSSTRLEVFSVDVNATRRERAENLKGVIWDLKKVSKVS